VRIRAGDKILVVGHTGSGKSTLASAIAARWPRVLVLDPKHDPEAELPNSHAAYGVADALRALPGRVIYRPRVDELADLAAAFDELARKVYLTGGTGILLHETADVAPSSGSRQWLNACIRLGRSRGIPIIFCTQRPAWIDRLALSEPAHVCLFRLWNRDDLSTICRVLGVETDAVPPLPTPYAFYYRGPDGIVRASEPIPLASAAAGALGTPPGPSRRSAGSNAPTRDHRQPDRRRRRGHR
jgi:DNA helicase HerA-like ATPase